MSPVRIENCDYGQMFIATDLRGEQKGQAVINVQSDKVILESLYVYPQDLHQGYGTELLQALIHWAINCGFNEIRGELKSIYTDSQTVKAVKQFYKKNGFRIGWSGKLSRHL